jgi:hypothetical protein
VHRIAPLTLAGLAALLAAGACSGRSERSGNGGDDASAAEGGTSAGKGGTSAGVSGGAGGVAGSGTGGRGGSGAAGQGGAVGGGAAGSGALGGDAGTTTTGGAGGAGQGGQAGGGRECDSADDCVRFTDCCGCMALPVGTAGPYCDLVCIQSACEAQQIGPEDVTCAFGRCVIDRSCNHALATCDETPEPCPDGHVRHLEDGCFGGCLAPTECRDVTDCTSCGSSVCVIEEPQIRTVGCVDPGDCAKGSYCDCLDACPPAGFVCIEEDDAVHCPCPVC